MEGTIATIMMFGGNFAPKNWALCNGALLSIASNTALFSLLGTNFGGDGRTTFGLPDLRGRSVVGAGQGPGLSPYTIGEVGGAEGVALNSNNLPPHTHTGSIRIPVSNNNGTTDQAAGNILATPNTDSYATAGTTPVLNYGGGYTPTVAPAGSSQPFSVLQPYLCINYVVCLYGIFPSRP